MLASAKGFGDAGRGIQLEPVALPVIERERMGLKTVARANCQRRRRIK